MARYVQDKNGKMRGSIGDAKERTPTPAPEAAARQVQAATASAGYSATYDQFAALKRGGVATPGQEYSSLTVYTRNPATGHIRKEWTKEMRGVWDGGYGAPDPAAKLIAQSRGRTLDGYVLHSATLTQVDSERPGAVNEYRVPLSGEDEFQILRRVSETESRTAAHAEALRVGTRAGKDLRAGDVIRLEDGRHMRVQHVSHGIDGIDKRARLTGVDENDGSEMSVSVPKKDPVPYVGRYLTEDVFQPAHRRRD